jgi:bifunctional non-homologous end joining protein LigD
VMWPARSATCGQLRELSRALGAAEVVVEATYLTWTEGGLLPAVSYQGQQEDKPARQVVRAAPSAGRDLSSSSRPRASHLLPIGPNAAHAQLFGWAGVKR